jgi:hypothetical protein
MPAILAKSWRRPGRGVDEFHFICMATGVDKDRLRRVSAAVEREKNRRLTAVQLEIWAAMEHLERQGEHLTIANLLDDDKCPTAHCVREVAKDEVTAIAKCLAQFRKRSFLWVDASDYRERKPGEKAYIHYRYEITPHGRSEVERICDLNMGRDFVLTEDEDVTLP